LGKCKKNEPREGAGQALPERWQTSVPESEIRGPRGSLLLGGAHGCVESSVARDTEFDLSMILIWKHLLKQK
jgi:hypothetical protein